MDCFLTLASIYDMCEITILEATICQESLLTASFIKQWLSIQLGKPELDDAIKDLLSLSHELTAPKKCKPKSSAKNPGDSANGKEKETDEG